jgi:hypothetical protein
VKPDASVWHNGQRVVGIYSNTHSLGASQRGQREMKHDRRGNTKDQASTASNSGATVRELESSV